DHFLADTGDGNHAPVLARPGMGDADPAGAIFVFLAVAVPMELRFHAAVLVRVYFIPRRAYDHGGLRPLYDRLGRDARRPKNLLAVKRGEPATVTRPFSWCRLIFVCSQV